MYAPMDYILCVFTYRFILVNTSSVESKKKEKKRKKGEKWEEAWREILTCVILEFYKMLIKLVHIEI